VISSLRLTSPGASFTIRRGFLWSQVEKKGLRGSAPARIDEKGRLKVPTIFRGLIIDQPGPDVFVTSLTGECVRIYPMALWVGIEDKLSKVPDNFPARLKFLDRVNYYGQTSEIDGQGRIVIPSHLRESASIVGDVRVFGRIGYLEVWNDDRFAEKLRREPWTDEDGVSLSEHGI
jgi:MraZ protein